MGYFADKWNQAKSAVQDTVDTYVVKPITQATQTVTQVVTSTYQKGRDAVQSSAETISGTIAQATEAVKDTVSSAVITASDIVSGGVEAVTSTVESAVSAVGDAVDTVTHPAKTILDKIKELIRKLINWIQGLIG